MSSTTAPATNHLGFAFMIDFLIDDHVVSPKCQPSGVTEAVVNILAAQHNSYKFVLVLLILKKYAEARACGLCDACFHTHESFDT